MPHLGDKQHRNRKDCDFPQKEGVLSCLQGKRIFQRTLETSADPCKFTGSNIPQRQRWVSRKQLEGWDCPSPQWELPARAELLSGQSPFRPGSLFLGRWRQTWGCCSRWVTSGLSILLAVPGAVPMDNRMTSYRSHIPGASLAESGPGAADVLPSCGLSRWWQLATTPLLCASISHLLVWGLYLGSFVPGPSACPWWPRASSQAGSLR